MKTPLNPSIQAFLQDHVLSLFALPGGNLEWHGDSELDMERLVYYFCINNEDYILVNELRHGVGDSKLTNLLNGNAVAPHQRVASVLPKVGQYTYVNLSERTRRLPPRLKGDFSVFRIIN